MNMLKIVEKFYLRMTALHLLISLICFPWIFVFLKYHNLYNPNKDNDAYKTLYFFHTAMFYIFISLSVIFFLFFLYYLIRFIKANKDKKDDLINVEGIIDNIKYVTYLERRKNFSGLDVNLRIDDVIYHYFFDDLTLTKDEINNKLLGKKVKIICGKRSKIINKLELIK